MTSAPSPGTSGLFIEPLVADDNARPGDTLWTEIAAEERIRDDYSRVTPWYRSNMRPLCHAEDEGQKTVARPGGNRLRESADIWRYR